MTDAQEHPAAEIRAALTLLGGLERQFADLPPERRANAEHLLELATKRLMRVVYRLEPRRMPASDRQP